MRHGCDMVRPKEAQKALAEHIAEKRDFVSLIVEAVEALR